jgi:hypothetical protein
MHLFLVHDASFFHQRLSLALGASYRKRSFEPLTDLVRELQPLIENFGQQFQLTSAERPLVFDCAGKPFDRRLWRHFAGELLLYAAAETPDFPIAPELLSRFTPPELIERLHRGSREVTFEGVPYRPDRAGLHDVADIAELAVELAAINPLLWTADVLSDLADDERHEDLTFARQCFEQLLEMVASAQRHGQLIVCENV